jgi:hypothetical protein
MTVSVTPTQLLRSAAILTAAVFLFTADGAFAKNGGNSDNHQMKSANSDHKEKHKDKDKDGEKHSKKDKDKDAHKDKDKDKDKDKTADKDKDKDKAPVIISGGFVKDKLPNGTVYYRRATQAELEKAAKANGGATTTTGNSGGTTPPAGTGGTTTTGTGTASNGAPPPAATPGHIEGSGDPVVRDHRPGGNAGGPVPGTIIRDHTNGADGTPKIVVSNSGGVLVTRKATDAELVKAGLKKAPAPTPVEVPIGMGGGGR